MKATLVPSDYRQPRCRPFKRLCFIPSHRVAKMGSANPRGSSGLPLRYSRSRRFVESRNLIARAGNAAYSQIRDAAQAGARVGPGRRPGRQLSLWQQAKYFLRSTFCIANFLVVLWMFTLWWGERTVFRDHISQCYWDLWEKWVRLRSRGFVNAIPANIFLSPPVLHLIMLFS